MRRRRGRRRWGAPRQSPGAMLARIASLVVAGIITEPSMVVARLRAKEGSGRQSRQPW